MEALDASLHCHLHEISDLLRRLLLHPVRNVGVGVQRKSRGEMAQHLGQGFDVHAILQCQRGEGVPQICLCQAQTNKKLKQNIKK